MLRFRSSAGRGSGLTWNPAGSQKIPAARNGLDELWVGGVDLYFDPQPTDQLGKTVIPDPRVVDLVFWPNGLDQVVFGANFTLMSL